MYVPGSDFIMKDYQLNRCVHDPLDLRVRQSTNCASSLNYSDEASFLLRGLDGGLHLG